MSDVIINQVSFNCPNENGSVFVPIKPVCEALGIANQVQQEVLKNHPVLSSVITLRVTTGGDGKQYEMLCIPLKYAFGWLLGIDARSVKPEAYEAVIRYQEEAYNALYERFFLEPVMQKQKLALIMEKEAAIRMAEAEKKEISARIRKMESELEEIKVSDAAQLRLFN